MFFLFNSACAYVLVTSKPVYMLVAPLMKNIDDVKILTSGHGCSHSYNLKFSDTQKVGNARLSVWMGQKHETVFAPLILKGKKVLSVFDRSNSFEWLSPKRMLIYVELLSDQILKTYPEKEKILRANAEEFLKMLKGLDVEVEKTKISRPLITTYPFLDAFAKDYGLEVKFSLAQVPSHALSLSQQAKLKQNSSAALLSDKHLSNASEFSGGCLDTEGVGTPLAENAYEIFIEKILADIVKCCQKQVGEKV